MKTEFYMHPEKGLCLLISGFALNDLNRMGISNGYHPTVSNPEAVAIEIRSDRKIHAIKELRAQTKWSLKEAKEYIDKYMPPGIDSVYDPHEAADKFIIDHTVVLNDFLGSNEMSI
jgi:hypothetical protein